MTKNDREHYEELSKWAFSKDSDGRPKASRFIVVLLSPILTFLFESKVSKNVGVIFGSLMLACFVSFLPVFPPGTTNLMIGLTLLSLVPSVIEVLLVFHLQSPRGRFLFDLLYQHKWIGIACHPKIYKSGSVGSDVNVWLTPESLRLMGTYFHDDGYPPPAFLTYPADWRSFELVCSELQLLYDKHPAVIAQRLEERKKREVYSQDPLYYRYVDDVTRVVKDVRNPIEELVRNLAGREARWALPYGFKVAHPDWRWRKRFNRGDVSVSELHARYVDGTAWVLYFPIGYSGNEEDECALSPKIALKHLGIKSPLYFDKNVQDWTTRKPLAAYYWFISLDNVIFRYLHESLSESVERARARENAILEELAEGHGLDVASVKHHVPRTWFEDLLSSEVEALNQYIQDFSFSEAATQWY